MIYKSVSILDSEHPERIKDVLIISEALTYGWCSVNTGWVNRHTHVNTLTPWVEKNCNRWIQVEILRPEKFLGQDYVSLWAISLHDIVTHDVN